MFNKTTSISFKLYGTIFNEDHNQEITGYQERTMHIGNKTINRFYQYDGEIFIKVEKGLVLLLVSSDDTFEQVEKFVVHRIASIKKKIYFNFITLSNQAQVAIYYLPHCKKAVTHIDTVLTYPKIIPSFQVKEIFAYYYQVRNIHYEFKGESHVYWELTYVDNGALETTINNETYTLKNFDLILYAPKQFHTQRNASDKSCSYLTIMFDMNLKDYDSIANRVFHCEEDLFSSLNNFIKASDAPQQAYNPDLLVCYLQELILKLLQYDQDNQPAIAAVPIQQLFENELLNEIIIYINNNIYKALSIDEICHKFSISRSSMQTLFKENLNIAPKHYINELKLSKSKLLIKEEKHTISEISVLLGFGSIHYFSRKFKQRFGVSPSDYAKSIYN